VVSIQLHRNDNGADTARRYDVIIVGGGPAGATAGIQLGGRGLRVALLDRAEFPRLKPCGGGIAWRAVARLPHLRAVLTAVGGHEVRRAELVSPSGIRAFCELDEPLYVMVRRIEFDAALIDLCRQKGVEVIENARISALRVEEAESVVTTVDGREFRAPLVIGADGVNSVIAQRSGLRGPWPISSVAVDAGEESPLTSLQTDPETMRLLFNLNGRKGYAYVFPKRHCVNLGYGFMADGHRHQGRDKAREEHLKLVTSLVERGDITGASDADGFYYGMLPVGGMISRLSTERVLLAGDAAGCVNAFTGEGLYYAMASGDLAARTALEALKQRDFSAAFLRRHDAACEAEMGEDLRAAVRLRHRFFSNDRRIDLAIRMAADSPHFCRLLALYAAGAISYQELHRKMLRGALPAYLRYKASTLWAVARQKYGK